MPIDATEWDEGRIVGDEAGPETTPVDEYDSEKDLVVAFLDENAGNAYTKWEIVRGVDFDSSDDPSQIRDTLGRRRRDPTGEIAKDVTDAVGDVVASGIVVDDVDEVMDELVEEGTVEAKEIEVDGETETYYRLASSET